MKCFPQQLVLQMLMGGLLSTSLFSQTTPYSSGHTPVNAATSVALSPTLRWTAGLGGTRHEVYFGTSEAAVQIAGRSSPEYKGRRSGTSYSPGTLSPATDYYWRIDETTTAFTPLYSGQTIRFTTAGNARRLPPLSGKTVAIWSKGAQRFVRSPGGAGGGLLADRDAYSDNSGEGRFLCAAESGDKLAIIDTLLQQYVALVGNQVVSDSAQPAAARRFALIDQGNNYYAIQADNGKYVRVNASGALVADLTSITTEAHFAIVPIRTGLDVVMRAYRGDDPYNQLPTAPNELAQFIQNPADFPVNKVNIGTLQMTAILSSDQQFRDMFKVWNTKRYEDEAIIPYDVNAPLVNQIDSVINQIKRIESLGYEYGYVILYHEILANLPGGPWSDPRISSQEEIDMFRTRVQLAHGRGELRHPRYKVFAMPYQFQQSLMGIPPFTDTPVGCDAATLNFIKQNFDGLFLEVNGHDYLSRNEHIDAAQAAAWCQANGLEFGLTSGATTVKDTVFKTMYRDIFSEMTKVGFDKSRSSNHYILHHTSQPYENRLPEWVADTTTENAKWLIEQVMPPETWSLPNFDTDVDGIYDEVEIRAGTYPLGPGGLLVPLGALAYEDFNFYTTGVLNAEAGSPTGFSGSWSSSG